MISIAVVWSSSQTWQDGDRCLLNTVDFWKNLFGIPILRTYYQLGCIIVNKVMICEYFFLYRIEKYSFMTKICYWIYRLVINFPAVDKGSVYPIVTTVNQSKNRLWWHCWNNCSNFFVCLRFQNKNAIMNYFPILTRPSLVSKPSSTSCLFPYRWYSTVAPNHSCLKPLQAGMRSDVNPKNSNCSLHLNLKWKAFVSPSFLLRNQ